MKTQICELVDTDETMFSTEGLTRLSTDDLVEKKLNIDAIHPYTKDGESKETVTVNGKEYTREELLALLNQTH